MLSIHEKLQTLARQARTEDVFDKSTGCNELYLHMVSLLEQPDHALTATERTLTTDILRYLIQDVEMSLRMAVAERLAGDPKAPVDLILMLANDRIEVARSVLTFSAVLDDEHLIDIIRTKAAAHQLCVAARRNLSPRVSSALVGTGERTVIRTLLHNMTAKLTPSDYQEILIHAQQDASLHAPLVQRSDIPKACLNRLYLLLSLDLKELINTKFSLPQVSLDIALDDAVESLLDDDQPEGQPERSTAACLIEKLHRGGQLSPAFLLKSLNQNQYDLFEHAFARLLNIPVSIFRSIQKTRELDGLIVACRAVGIDRSVLLTLYGLVRRAQGLSPEISAQERELAYAIYEKMDKRKAEITIHCWAADASRSPIF
ncbi:DUF2336 domain-containing protein [Govanella unica]|uniref:DUF2336 domain-containing protein n=1 Tax=Govanella unica TaxID=2975056 RepID=A0A9X3TYD6_9PROT|nr:DUF2336 domain-containing protein [Govania unica]MDA5194053.1 DUF2336 domain-containing protein [Govania unica]